MLPRFDQINPDYIAKLPDDGPEESRTLDYKVMFSKGGEIDAEELRKDVVQFANTVGGDLVVGVAEEKGKATKVLGVECSDPDKLRRNINSALREIDPRFTGYEVKFYPWGDGRFVIVIRVIRSWQAPHRTRRIDGSFMYRTNTGHEHMNIDQIREAFVASAGLETRLQQFRARRLSNLGAGAPMPLVAGMRTVLHIMPLASATAHNLLDVVGNKDKLHTSRVFLHGWPDTGVNFEGAYAIHHAKDDQAYCYSLWLRSGIREIVWCTEPQPPQRGDSDTITIYDEREFGRQTERVISETLVIYEQLGVPAPYFVALSLDGCAGWKIGWFHERIYSHQARRDGRPAQHGQYAAPELIIESRDTDVPQALQPALNHLANAFGCSHSHNYDDNGNWAHKS